MLDFIPFISHPVDILISWMLSLAAGAIAGRFVWIFVKRLMCDRDKDRHVHSIAADADAAMKESITINADAQSIYDQLIGG